MTTRENELIAGVNLKLEQRRREDRWWWLAGVRRFAWLIGTLALLFWFWRTYLPENYWFLNVTSLAAIYVYFLWRRLDAMEAKIRRLESRVAELEGISERGEGQTD